MQVLVDLIDGDPTADNNRLFRKWWEAVQADDELLDAVALHAFTNMVSALDRDRKKPAKPAVQSARQVKALRAEVAKITERVRNLVLMDLTLPNGKKLRNSTFKECSLAGGWFKLLACKGKPSQIVGKVLSEADLHALK